MDIAALPTVDRTSQMLAELAIVPEPGAAAETAIVVEDEGNDVAEANDEEMADLKVNFAVLEVCAVLGTARLQCVPNHLCQPLTIRACIRVNRLLVRAKRKETRRRRRRRRH